MELNEKIKKILKRAKLEEVYEYINDCVIKNTYIIYDSHRNKAVCTRCGSEWDIAPGEYTGCHNSSEHTACCGAPATVKSTGRGRNNLEETFRIIYMFRFRKTAYVMVMNCRANFWDFGKPKINFDTQDIYEFNAKGQYRYKRTIDYYSGGIQWHEMKSISLPSPPSGSYAFLSPFYDTYIYDGNVEEVFTSTDLKYLWSPELIETLSPGELIRYMDQGVKYQSIEMLYKAGFKNLVRDRLKNRRTGVVYWRGTNLQKILRLPMRDIRRIREANPDCMELEVFQRLSDKERRELPWAFVKDMTYCHRGEEYEEIRSRTNLLKFAKYIQEQVNTYHIPNVSAARGYWLDYIKMATDLGMDLRKNRIMFPENLKKTHDEATDRWQSKKNKKLDADIKAHAQIMNYEQGDLMIVTATSQKMLNNESTELGHCVKTYGQKLGKGECRIYFIRRKDQPDASYYTLETTPAGELIQCRGRKNCGMTEEVKTFVEGFIKELKKELKKKPKEEKKCRRAA